MKKTCEGCISLELLNQPFHSRHINPETRSFIIDVPEGDAGTVQGVGAPHCAVGGLIYAEPNLLDEGLPYLPPDGQLHQAPQAVRAYIQARG